MYKLWGKIIKNNDIISDHTYDMNTSELDADKVMEGIQALCYHFDIQKPLWLSDNRVNFAHVGKARFFDHHFIETINFDYFEIEIFESI